MERTRSNRSGFEQRLLATLRDIGVDRGRRWTIAFSGGVDSLALSLALNRVAKAFEAELRLVHVNHGLRPGSAQDAAACRQLADELGIAIQVVTLEPGLAGRAAGIGIEEAARRERYVALAEAAKEWGSSTVVLGHQANDQAETVILHLSRGSGLDGMAGMRLVEPRRVPWWTDSAGNSVAVTLLRPILAESRSTIRAYVSAAGLRPVDDESNATTAFDRNWVRHEVLPRLVDRWPAAIDSIQRSARAMAIDREFLSMQADSAYADSIFDDRTLRLDALGRLDRAIAYRVLRRWLVTIDGIDVDLDAIDRLYELGLSNDERRSIEVGGEHRFVVDNGRLTTFDTLCCKVGQVVPIAAVPSGAEWEIQVSNEPEAGDALLDVAAGTTLEVRAIQAGDCWSGTNRSVLEDLRAAGIHPLVREHVLAVAWTGGVLLIPAIYPTIRGAQFDGHLTKVGVRWNKRS